jgi:hypothetical protein
VESVVKKWLVGSHNVIDSVEYIRVGGGIMQGIIEKFPAVTKGWSTSLDRVELSVSSKNTEN